MSSTVFVLGAGASSLAGAPLMKDFLDVSRQLWKTGKVRPAEDSFRLVFGGIDSLQAVHSKADLDIHNIESVFATFEMAKTLGVFPGHQEKDLDILINALKTVIVNTLEQTVAFSRRDKQTFPPEPYIAFAELLQYLKESAFPAESTAVITFNYDMALDYALHFYGVRYAYCIDNVVPAETVPVLKMHGSLNWAHCSKCDKVVPVKLTEFFEKFRFSSYSDNGIAHLAIGTKLDTFKHCDVSFTKEPVLVPPTWHKEDYHRSISNVWKTAARELSEAENIFVIGYSLPLSDAFFRYLYALGTVGRANLQRFWVYDIDSSDVVKNRFGQLLGTQAKARYKYIQANFRDAIQSVKNNFPSRG